MTLPVTDAFAQAMQRDQAGAGVLATSADTTCCPVVELRRYSLHPGMRETLITLFDREFVDAQEAVGIRVIAQFRDIDHPDFFTWMRGFPEMESRATALGAFYFGPLWARYKNEANATMISSDNVRLLRPTHPRAGIAMSADRPAPGATAIPAGLVVVTIYTLTSMGADGFADWFESTVAPRLAASGARPIASFETNASINTFPRLPVREGEHAFVWVANLADVKAYDAYVVALAADSVWRTSVRAALERRFAAPVEVWRLTPTARSRTVR